MMRSVVILGLATLGIVAPLSATPTTEPAARPAPTAEGEALTIADCHDAAAAHLAKVCEDYRRLKAMELSKLRDIPYEEAYSNIQPVMPVLRPINRPLLVNRITNPDDVPAHKREVEQVESDVTAMVALAQRLTREMQATTPSPPVVTPSKPAAAQNTAASNAAAAGEAAQAAAKEVEKLARENSAARAVDLSRAMRAALGAAPADSRHELPGSAAGTGEREIEKVTFKARDWGFGRHLTSDDGTPMEWMFIDTWYTIGPFPNPKRVNINTKFPPETVVDLSATYPGKDGREVAWEFLQTNRAQCAPNRSEQYAIYYAYTELWFDEDTDLWIAVGSDDKSNLWINNQPVWISGEELKKWRINEGFRKVYFKKGLNKILYRVENGWSNTYFSLGIQVRPQSK